MSIGVSLIEKMTTSKISRWVVFEETVAHVEDDSNIKGAFISPQRMQYAQSSDITVLDQLLGNHDGATPESEPRTERRPSSSCRRRANQCINANALIATRCTVMVGTLEMCKDEMATANKADADRDTIDSCLDELESIHGRQREKLTTLHEKLLEFSGS